MAGKRRCPDRARIAGFGLISPQAFAKCRARTPPRRNAGVRASPSPGLRDTQCPKPRFPRASRMTKRRRPIQMRATFLDPHRSQAEASVCRCAVMRRARPPLIRSSGVAGRRRGRRKSRSAAPRSQPSGHRAFLADRASGGTPGRGLPIRGAQGNGGSAGRGTSNAPRDQLVIRCGPTGRPGMAWRAAGFDSPPVEPQFDPSIPGYGQPPQDSLTMSSVGSRSDGFSVPPSRIFDTKIRPALAVSCRIVLTDGVLRRLNSMSS